MAKGQKRSGREPKKPKQNKVKGFSPATALPAIQPKLTTPVKDHNK